MTKSNLTRVFILAAIIFTPSVFADQVKTTVEVLPADSPSVLGATTDNYQVKCEGDFDEADGVDIKDLTVFMNFYQQPNIACYHDMIGDDCLLDETDLALFMQQYQSPSCDGTLSYL